MRLAQNGVGLHAPHEQLISAPVGNCRVSSIVRVSGFRRSNVLVDPSHTLPSAPCVMPCILLFSMHFTSLSVSVSIMFVPLLCWMANTYLPAFTISPVCPLYKLAPCVPSMISPTLRFLTSNTTTPAVVLI